MANLSRTRAPDWITAVGQATAGGGIASAHASHPAWITARGLAEPDTPGGFREALPFGTSAVRTDPEPETADAPRDEVTPLEDAYMRGYAEGHAEAKRGADTALADEQARYGELRLAFRTLDAAAISALTQDLNATVLALCEQVLGDFALDREALLTRCEAAAKRLGAGPKGYTVHLHPQTRERIAEGALPGWRFEDDDGLKPGALRLTGADGSVRDGPEDWMRAFTEALGA